MADDNRSTRGYWLTDTETRQHRSVRKGMGQNPGADTTYGPWNDPTVNLANDYRLYVDIYSVHTKTNVKFKAMLDNYAESVNTQLASETLVGHAEPLRKVKGLDRSISIGLNLVAGDLYQARYNLRDLGLFVKMMHPAVEVEKVAGVDQKLVLAGGDPLFKIRFMNFLVEGTTKQSAHINAKDNGLKGYIDGLQYSFDLDSGFFGGAGDEAGFVYPQLIKMSFNFYPFYSSTPAWTFEEKGGEARGAWTNKGFSHPNAPHAYRAQQEGDFPSSWNQSTPGNFKAVDDARMSQALDQEKGNRK